MPDLVSSNHLESAARLREILSTWAEGRDLVEIGAYEPGSNPALDRAIEVVPLIERLTAQGRSESTDYEECLAAMQVLADLDGGQA